MEVDMAWYSKKWRHASGDDPEDGCLACIEELPYTGVEVGFKPHPIEPDPDGDAGDPYCWVCGHDVEPA